MYLESYKSVCSLGSSSDSNSNSNAQPQVAEGPVSTGDKIEGLTTNSTFYVCFSKEHTLICLRGESMTPHRGGWWR